jgi:hypothetical protein
MYTMYDNQLCPTNKPNSRFARGSHTHTDTHVGAVSGERSPNSGAHALALALALRCTDTCM